MQGINQEKIFFIIGIGRSGTALLQELMNTFDGFCNTEESEVNGHGSGSCWTLVRRSGNFSDLEKFLEEKWTKEFFVEKIPDSITCLPEMLQRFANSNYIFLERDPHKIILSQLNLFPGELLDNAKKYHLENLVITKEALDLPHEQYWAKLNLNHINLQKQHKNKFRNALTVKYEFLVDSLNERLCILGKYFGIIPNLTKAKTVFQTPSSSSKINKYEIKELHDSIAITMVNEACKLWNYPPFYSHND